MDQTLEQLAMGFVTPPECRKCSAVMRFELADAPKDSYTGRVRLSCDCGDSGAWRAYPLYSFSIPEMIDVLRSMARAYTEGGEHSDG